MRDHVDEAVDQHLDAMETSKASVETDIKPESTDKIQDLARDSKKQSKKKVGAA